jgi:cation transport ATPase
VPGKGIAARWGDEVSRYRFITLPLPLGEGRGEGELLATKAPSPCPLPRGEGSEIANVASQQVLLGSPQWLRGEGCTIAEHLWSAVEAAGGGDAPLSFFVFHEELRPEARPALDECRRLGMQVAVVTGDRRSRALRLAESLGAPVFAEQLPEDKVAAIGNARQRFGPVAMVGDGINDAPALAASDVGVAMGCGADLSRESAAICLLSNDLARLPWTIGLARQTIRIIRQNLCWSFSYNLAGIVLAASGRLSPVFAAGAMVASSAFVVTNSLRLNRFPEPVQPARSHVEHGNAMEPESRTRELQLTP